MVLYFHKLVIGIRDYCTLVSGENGELDVLGFRSCLALVSVGRSMNPKSFW